MSQTMSMYSYSIPVLTHALKSLSAILDKAKAHAGERKIDPIVLSTARLFPDMFPLNRQVMIACDLAKGCGARLSGTDNPVFEDTETSFDEVQARIAKTLAFLEGISESAFAGAEDRIIKFKAGPNELEFVGVNYLREWVYPNFYFHLTTAYNILRHNGVSLGKLDYLGAALK